MVTSSNVVSGGASASGSGTDVTTSVSFTVSTNSPASDSPGGLPANSPANPPVNSRIEIVNKFNIADYWWVFLIFGGFLMLGMIFMASRGRKRRGSGAAKGYRGIRFGKLGRSPRMFRG